MKRIFLFILTNLAVVFVINITLRLLGVDRILNQSGGINFNALLVMSLVIGFSGSIISLLMSKWSAKRMVGAQVIEIRQTRPSAGWSKPCVVWPPQPASACRKWRSMMRRT